MINRYSCNTSSCDILSSTALECVRSVIREMRKLGTRNSMGMTDS
jgi:hypothetical protein